MIRSHVYKWKGLYLERAKSLCHDARIGRITFYVQFHGLDVSRPASHKALLRAVSRLSEQDVMSVNSSMKQSYGEIRFRGPHQPAFSTGWSLDPTHGDTELLTDLKALIANNRSTRGVTARIEECKAELAAMEVRMRLDYGLDDSQWLAGMRNLIDAIRADPRFQSVGCRVGLDFVVTSDRPRAAGCDGRTYPIRVPWNADPMAIRHLIGGRL